MNSWTAHDCLCKIPGLAHAHTATFLTQSISNGTAPTNCKTHRHCSPVPSKCVKMRAGEAIPDVDHTISASTSLQTNRTWVSVRPEPKVHTLVTHGQDTSVGKLIPMSLISMPSTTCPTVILLLLFCHRTCYLKEFWEHILGAMGITHRL